MSAAELNVAEVIAHAIYFDPKNRQWSSAMNLQDVLDAVPRLFDLLDEREIDYAVVGGVAQLAHIEGRNTQDVDLIAPRTALAALPELAVKDQTSTTARTSLDGLQVDFLFSSDKLFSEVLRRHTQDVKLADRTVRCATVKGILLLKLYALPDLYRQGRFARVDLYQSDVQSLLRHYEELPESLLAELSGHVLASDLEQLREIVAEIVQRIAKSHTRFQSPSE